MLCAVPVLLTLQIITAGQTADYLDKLLDSVGRYYVVLDVSSIEYTGKVVIENDELYGFSMKRKDSIKRHIEHL